jgi:hypothetical protein
MNERQVWGSGRERVNDHNWVIVAAKLTVVDNEEQEQSCVRVSDRLLNQHPWRPSHLSP